MDDMLKLALVAILAIGALWGLHTVFGLKLLDHIESEVYGD